MRTLSIEVPVELPADDVFSHLAAAGGLGPFLSDSVRPEANRGQTQVDEAGRRLTWEHDSELGGSVSVVERRPGTCTVVVELRAERTDHDLVRTELERAVAALAQRALADGDSAETGRAWH